MSAYRPILDELFAVERALLRAQDAIGSAIELVLAKSAREMPPDVVEKILAELRAPIDAADATADTEPVELHGNAATHQCVIPEPEMKDEPPSHPVVESDPRNSNSI